MTVNNQILCTIEFVHEYYTDEKCPDLEVIPTPATAKIMQGQWLSIHPFENGFSMAYAPEKLTDPQDPAFTYEKLRFLLGVKDSGFFHYTDIDWQEGTLFYYSFDQTGQLETSQVKLFGQLFNYSFSVAEIAPLTLRITNSSEIEVYEQVIAITENENDIQIDLRGQPGGRYKIILLQNELVVEQEQCLIDASLLGKNIFGILETPGISPADPLPPPFQLSFQSRQSTWKYYVIVQKEDAQYMAILKDKENGAQNNRYSDIEFEFCERPVEKALNGEQVFLFETGTVNEQDEFIPQLIPAFQENKKELFLIKYEHHSGPGGGPSYFFEKCIKEEFWNKKKKKHIFPPGLGKYYQKKFKKNGITVLRNLQNPPMNKLNKEVFIYL